ncbi:sel1 repeat family protein, partial [Acinetobacter baumannii]
MFFILRKKLQKIGIILVAINLLACGHQPDFK